MRFTQRPRRPLPESVVPMINVVFLLLIFFLMSARLAPPLPLEVELPKAGSDSAAEEDIVVYLDPDGLLAMGDLQGDAVWQTLADLTSDRKLTLRADAGLPGVELAKILARLAGIGISGVDLAVRQK